MRGGSPGPAASVIVSTYDRLEALRLAVAGFRRQSRTDFEMLVADDGSGPATTAFLEEAAGRLPFTLLHVRQADRGFRKSRILNEAAARASADYLIFSDGDCIPGPRYVESHLERRASGRYLVGRSAFMSRRFCRRLDAASIRRGRLDRVPARLLLDGLMGRSRRVEYALRPPTPWLRRAVASLKSSLALFGSNFSLWRSDFLAVNGFEEAFTGWGGEDEELGVRLENAGREARSVVWSAISYHYWHPRSHARLSRENARRLRETRESGRTRARRGVDAHLDRRMPRDGRTSSHE